MKLIDLSSENATLKEAYKMWLRASKEVYGLKKENHLKGIALAERTIELDPKFGGGYELLSLLLSRSVRFGYSTSPREDLERALELAQKAISVDDTFALSYTALASAYLMKRQHDDAVAAARTAVSIQPGNSLTLNWLGFYLHWAGRGEEARAMAQQLLKTNPKFTLTSWKFAMSKVRGEKILFQ